MNHKAKETTLMQLNDFHSDQILLKMLFTYRQTKIKSLKFILGVLHSLSIKKYFL